MVTVRRSSPTTTSSRSRYTRAGWRSTCRRRLVGTNGIYGPRSVDLWGSEGDLAIVAGAVGLVYEAIEILLTSSGLGDRGSYDTAPHGYGLGLPAAYIDTASLRRYPLDQWCIVASDSQSSVADLVGGWLVLYELCLEQRRTKAPTRATSSSPW